MQIAHFNYWLTFSRGFTNGADVCFFSRHLRVPNGWTCEMSCISCVLCRNNIVKNRKSTLTCGRIRFFLQGAACRRLNDFVSEGDSCL